MSKILSGLVAALLIIGVSTPVFAHDGSDDSTSAEQEEQHNETTTEDKPEIRSEMTPQSGQQSTGSTRGNIRDMRSNLREGRTEIKENRTELKEAIKSQKEQIDQRKTELKQKIEALRAERKVELTDKRLELCEKRQATINELITKSAKTGQERLQQIQSFEAKVKEFYTNKKLSSSEYDAAASVVDEKEALAVAAVEVMQAQKFECAKVDGEKPAGEIRSIQEAKFTALNDYRDSVKQLIQIVKAAMETTTNAEGTTDASQ